MAADAPGFRVVEVQSTPNPNAMKYVLDRVISEQSLSFFNAAAAADHPLARELFTIDGVSGLLIVNDFVTVNKLPGAVWSKVTPRVKKVLQG